MAVHQDTVHQAKTFKMRWFLLGILFLLSSCVNEYKNPLEPGAHNAEHTLIQTDFKIVKAILKQYAPEATVFFVGDQPLSYNILGLTNELGPHVYLVQISKNNPQPLSTLFHELGHVIDGEMGRLEWDPYKWEGQKINFDKMWHERPWEISANEWRDCLVYEYENRQLEYYDYTLEDWLKTYKLNLVYFN